MSVCCLNCWSGLEGPHIASAILSEVYTGVRYHNETLVREGEKGKRSHGEDSQTTKSVRLSSPESGTAPRHHVLTNKEGITIGLALDLKRCLENARQTTIHQLSIP